MLVNGRDDLFIATQPGGKATQEGKLGKDRLKVQGDDQPLGAGTGSRMGKRRNLSDPMDCSPPGSSIHGIFQARVLEGVPLPSPKQRKAGGNRWVAVSAPAFILGGESKGA